jgi:HSP20 family molecular chaperone IbpA
LISNEQQFIDIAEKEMFRMRFMPALRRDEDFDLFDDVFNAPFFGREALMKTDITEKDGKYHLEMDLPGYQKEDVKVSLYNGDLTIEANHSTSNDEKDSKGNVVRQERYTGSCSRTFYVGENAKESDVHASFKDGVLKIEVPSDHEKNASEKKLISIE